MNKRIKQIIITLIISNFACTGFALDIKGVSPVNPLDLKNDTYHKELSIPVFELKRATLTKNAVKNQYAIAMDKFMKSNVRASYSDFKVLIDSVTPNDYVYMRLTKEMAEIGFFNLAELAMSKIDDRDISNYLQEDVKRFYFPSSVLTGKDQLYLAEMYSNIMYNNQSTEATAELIKQSTLLVESDYANYITDLGFLFQDFRINCIK